MRQAKGQSLISIAALTGIVVVSLAIFVTVTVPVLENLRDSAAIDSATDMLSSMERQVERVAEGGEGSGLNATVQFSRGRLLVDEAEDEIAYELDTSAEIIAPHTSKRVGNLLLSAMSSVTVKEAEVDGQDCWRVENDHVQACIRAVEEPEDAIGSDTVGFWRFSQGEGQTVVDNSSYGNNGTLGGSSLSEASDPSRASGLRGNALEFDGGDEYASVPDDSTLDGMDSLTVSAWVNPDDTTGAEIVRKDESYYIRLDSGAADFKIYNNTDVDGPTGGDVQSGNWHHLALTFNGSRVTGYVDGASIGQETVEGSIRDSSTALGIGNNGEGDRSSADGKIDEVRIYNRSLSTEGVQYLYNSSGYPDYIDTRDLLLSYRNKDEAENLSADFKMKIRAGLKEKNFLTMNGTGTATPALTGAHLGRGRVTADVKSFYGIDYRLVFQLFSGSDFLQVQVEES